MNNESIKNIAALADGREDLKTRRSFTEEELNAYKADHVKNAFDVRDVQKEITTLNNKKQKLNKSNQDILDKIHLGFEDIELEAYYIDDQDESVRRYYHPDNGQFLQMRKLTPAEKQTRIAANTN